MALDPAHAAAFTNLGAVLALEGRTDEAATAYQQAIKANPQYAEAYNNYGNLLTGTGTSGTASNTTARPSVPAERSRYAMLVGLDQRGRGMLDEAARCFGTGCATNRDDPIAQHLPRVLGREASRPGRPTPISEKSFDEFADTFDASPRVLEYRAPRVDRRCIAQSMWRAEEGAGRAGCRLWHRLVRAR